MDDNTGPPPSPPLSPPAPEQPLTLATLPDDALALLIHRLHDGKELLPLALTAKVFNQLRRQLGLKLITDGKTCVRRLRLLEWACWRLPTGCSWLECPLHRSQGCVWAAGAGCLPAILWLRGEGLWLCGEDCLAAAAHGGHHELLVALWKLGCSADWRCCAWAAAEGHLLTLMVARRLGFVWDEMVCANAAGAGALNVLRWARSPDYSALPSLPSLLCSPASSPLASRTGSPSTSPPISPARRHRSIHPPHTASVATIPSHHVASPASPTSPVSPDSRLRYPPHVNDVLGSGSASGSDDGGGDTSPLPSPDRALRQQAAGARGTLSSSLHRTSPVPPEGSPCQRLSTAAAAPGGNGRSSGVPGGLRPRPGSLGGELGAALARLEATPLDASPAPWDSWAVAAAAGGGHIDVLEYIWSEAAPGDRPRPDTQACAFAAACGQIEALQWLRARQAPWDAQTCSEAAQGGHLAALRWCREHGCEWDTETACAAAGAGHHDVLVWCAQNGCPWDGAEVVNRASEGGFEQIAEWAAAFSQSRPAGEVHFEADASLSVSPTPSEGMAP